MAEFYTSANVSGDKILVRGYENGRPFRSKVDFRPTMYVASKTSSDWKTLDGSFVEPINPGSIKDTKEFVKRYENVEGFPIYGNTNYAYQYISDTYSGDIEWDISKIKVYTVDIETKTESDAGFPSVLTVDEEITLITLKDLISKRVTTFSCLPCDFKTDRSDISFFRCQDEASMLKAFLAFWMADYPDIITGWNTDFFDNPYLIRRIDRVLGDGVSNGLSPWGQVRERKTFIKGAEEIHYDIVGISQLDYLELYKKYTYSKQESYRLDYIAEVELGDRKKENPGNSFREFYTDFPDVFILYNIHDVELVDALEDKMHLLELHLTMSYGAKINPEDVFSQIRMWDTIIYNHLRKNNIVIPLNERANKGEQFEGAYVKDPIVGLHKWVVSFDATSLYPSIMQMLNISPETYSGVLPSVSVESMHNKTTGAYKDFAVGANGALFSKEKKGLYGELIDFYMAERKRAKNLMLAKEAELEVLKSSGIKSGEDYRRIVREISSYNNKQMAFKIALNSLYGAAGNNFFRFFNLEIARAITLTGQYIIQHVDKSVNEALNKLVGTTDYVYAMYCDTDSVYLRLDPLVNKFFPNLPPEKTVQVLDNFCKDKLTAIINKACMELQEHIGAYRNTISFKRESIADVGIWCGKKRYILNVHNSEGVQYAKPKVKIMGLEMIKSSTPSVIRQKLKDAIPIILTGSEATLQKFVMDFREEFDKLPIEAIAFPRGVNGMKEYAGSPIYTKGTPIHVRGALLHNHHLKRLGVKSYQPIKSGDKIKFVYVRKPNPFQEDVIAFSQTLPKEFNLDSYIDKERQFEKVFLDALQNVITSLGWKPVEESSLESFFG